MIDTIRRLVGWALGSPGQSQQAPPKAARLHVPRSILASLRRLTRPNPERAEPLALLRVRYASEASPNVVIGIGTIPFPDFAYVAGPAGANFDSDWLVGIANREIGTNVGLVLVHSHGGAGTPGFSLVDRRTNARVMAPLAIGVEEAPYGAVVLSDDNARAVVTVASSLTSADVISVPDRIDGFEAHA